MTNPIISLIVLLLSLGFTFFYVVPEYHSNQERRASVDVLAKALLSTDEIEALINKTKNNLVSIGSTELPRFEVFLPETIDPIRFANNIQTVAGKNGIALKDIRVTSADNADQQDTANNTSANAKSTENKYATTKASFTFTASYGAFQLFLNDLERSLGLIKVSYLEFTATPTEQYSMEIETYSLK